MPDEEETQPLSELIDELDKRLGPNHAARTMLCALEAMGKEELDHCALQGPENPSTPLWLSLLSLGTVANGELKFYLYPPPQSSDDLRDRDILLNAVRKLPGRATGAKEMLAQVPAPSTTVAIAYYGELKDGTKLLGLAWHPDLSFEKAKAHLKLAERAVRIAESNTAGGDS